MKPVKVLAAAGAASFGLICASSAVAAGITIGQFQELSGNPPGAASANTLSYVTNVDEGPGQPFASSLFTGGVESINTPVIFSYDSIVGLPSDLQGPQKGTLLIQTATNQPAVSLGGGVDGEAFAIPGPFSYTLAITRDTPAAEGNGSQTNLLTVHFNSGELLATPGNDTASFTSSTPTYSSDFLNFTNSSPQDLALAFSSWTSSDGGGVEVNPITNFLQFATFAGVGTFDVSVGSTTMFPEPGAAALAAMGAFALLCGRPRRTA